MLLRMLKKDLKRNRTIAVALFVFVMLSALLAASGSNMIMQLFRSMDHLFAVSNAPHFVQMHAGEIDETALDEFASDNPMVRSRQLAEMLIIDNASIYYGDRRTPDSGSVMDNGFVEQNERFDFLLNLDNERIAVSNGEIAVPIYYKQRENLELGDRIRIASASSELEFTIVDFVRDVQMNPSIISSKRFVVSAADFEALRPLAGEVETMIGFQLNDLSKLGEFKTAYQSAGLPSKGPTIDYSLLQMLNVITDGLVAAIILLVSLLLMVIAGLCLRFTLIATMEEEYREIGVMKAIGIRQSHMRKIYRTKYLFLAGAACLCGYALSVLTSGWFTSNIALYIGSAPRNALQLVVPILSAAVVFALVWMFCSLVLRKMNKISAVEALRFGTTGGNKVHASWLPLHKSRLPSLNIFLGVKDVLGRFRMYLLLFLIFVICSFMMIVPINFLSTVHAPSFVSYMGAGQSDIRIDLQQSENIRESFAEVQAYLAEDRDIAKFAPLVTSKYGVIGAEGALENIQVETGDFSQFPLKYSKGNAPASDNEIALSSLNAEGLGKGVGDTVTVVADGKSIELQVSGIYQDVTNGGKTAKALLPPASDRVLWYTINANVQQGVDVREKVAEYAKLFQGAKITPMEDYLSQTLGSTLEQIKKATLMGVAVALCISFLITSLFLKMLTAKEASGIAVMKCIGFADSDIRKQYIARTMTVLATAILVGTAASNTLGQGLVGMLMSARGASSIQFVTSPLVSYVVCPLALALFVTGAALLATRSLKQYSIVTLSAE
ncbi:ABC transporter permease [Cohnella boryungensis]|uniref:ABC transporter permease n=1 Tax=Cohnella boryungensis TaxID=768479 RepID=A0ABV8SKS1_9BACL